MLNQVNWDRFTEPDYIESPIPYCVFCNDAPADTSEDSDLCPDCNILIDCVANIEDYQSHNATGVTGYFIGKDFILVEMGENLYRYSTEKAGETHVTEMQKLAKQGYGLSRYLFSTQPKYDYRLDYDDISLWY